MHRHLHVFSLDYRVVQRNDGGVMHRHLHVFGLDYRVVQRNDGCVVYLHIFRQGYGIDAVDKRGVVYKHGVARRCRSVADEDGRDGDIVGNGELE